MLEKRVHLDAFACCHVANHVALVQYFHAREECPILHEGKIDEHIHTSLYWRDEIRLKVSKLASGAVARQRDQQRTFGDKAGRKTNLRERERERETLFTLRYIERTGIYTQSHVSLPPTVRLHPCVKFLRGILPLSSVLLFLLRSLFPASPSTVLKPLTPVLVSTRKNRPPPLRARYLSLCLSLSLSLCLSLSLSLARSLSFYLFCS